jgi:thiamine biosynthesis lipoprotein
MAATAMPTGAPPMRRPASGALPGAPPMGRPASGALAGVPMQRVVFAAMGTRVEALLEAPHSGAAQAALARVRGEFERLEGIFSRFRRHSELSRLNEAGSIEAGPDLRAVVELALAARERTAGRFDPTLHHALVAAGYDRTFDELDEHSVARPAPDPRNAREVAVRGRRIELGPGVRLDLGGIVKGYAADRCAQRLAPLGPCLVNAGGDLAVAGTRSVGPWPVAVDVPGARLTLAVASGGLATTGRDRRRWRQHGEERHHVIDPATCRPAEGSPLTVTVAGPTATDAEVAAKSIFLAGERAEREAELLGTPAVIARADGRLRLVGGLA